MNEGFSVLNLLSSVFLNGDFGSFSFFLFIPFMFGLWKIFTKCGGKGWWGLIPVLREYKLGKCANREEEGRVLALMRILSIFVNLFTSLSNLQDTAVILIALFIAGLLSIIEVIYDIKVGLGVIELFGQKKIWIILWVLFPCIPAVIWGFGKKYQPLWKLQAVENEAATFFSNNRAAVLDKGLTINLDERTAKEFLKPKKYLLRDIHMYVKPGHMVLLLGGSGAGKTTFVNAVNGYEPAKAEVMLNGSNMYTNYKHMQYDIGFVPQLDLMRGSDTVLRTLMDAAALRLPTSFSRAERQARVDQVMEIFGLAPVKNSLVSKLSGGQRKRLSIAMEFIPNPTLFILDEPDSGLDGVMARELFVQLREIADQGKIIIVITHTPDRVIDLFDDVIVLAKDANRTGRLAWFGSISEARAFFGKEKMEEIVKAVNRQEEGGEGRADEFIMKYAEVQHV